MRLKNRKLFLFLSIFLLLSAITFSVSLQLKKPRYVIEVNFTPLTDLVPNSDIQAILIPVRYRVLNWLEDKNYSLASSTNESYLVLSYHTDNQAVSSDLSLTIDKVITQFKFETKSFYLTQINVYQKLMDQYKDALSGIDLMNETMSEDILLKVQGKNTLLSIAVLERRTTNYSNKILGFTDKDSSIQNKTSNSSYTLKMTDRYVGLGWMTGGALFTGCLLILILSKKMNSRKKTKLTLNETNENPSPWIILSDDAFVFLLLSSFMVLGTQTLLKAVVLSLTLLYVVFKKKFSYATYWPYILLLLFLNLLLHMGSPFINYIIDDTIKRFLLYFIVSALVYIIYNQAPRLKLNIEKLAVFIVIDIIALFVLFVPNMFMSGQFKLVRFDGFSAFNLVYVSANLLAFYAFTGHIILLWLNERKTNFLKSILGQKWIRIGVHLIFLALGIMSQSRSYYVFIFIWLGIIGLLQIKKIFKSMSWKTLIKRSIYILIGAVIFTFILRSSNDFAYTINRLSANTLPLSLQGRFISLIKILFTNIPLIDGSTHERLSLFGMSWELFVRNPFSGVGLGAFSAYATQQIEYGIFVLKTSYSHVEFMEMLSSVGLFGTILYYLSYKELINIRHRSVSLGIYLFIGITSGFIFGIYYEKLIWWVMISFIALAHLEAKNEN